jgi:hypothetical protein
MELLMSCVEKIEIGNPSKGSNSWNICVNLVGKLEKSISIHLFGENRPIFPSVLSRCSQSTSWITDFSISEHRVKCLYIGSVNHFKTQDDKEYTSIDLVIDSFYGKNTIKAIIDGCDDFGFSENDVVVSFEKSE